MYTEQTLKRKPFVIAGNPYRISLTARFEKDPDPVSIRVTIQAYYGQRSTCIVRGLHNYDYWDNYGCDPSLIQPFAVTPKVLCQIVQLAHDRGWDPVNSKSNCEV